MAKASLAPGTTSYSAYVYITDTSGNPITGMVFNSTGLIAYYVRNRAAAVAISLATLAAVTTAWTSGGFKEIDATNAKGLYRVDIPDAAFAAGVDKVIIELSGATSPATMRPCLLEYDLNASVNVNSMLGTVLGAGGAIPWLGIAESGSTSTFTASSITLRVGTVYATNDDPVGSSVWIYTGTGQGQIRYITAYNASTRVATLNAAFTTTLSGTVSYIIFPIAANTSINTGLATLAQLQTMLQLNGAGPNYQFTLGALAQSPSADPELLFTGNAGAGGTGTTMQSTAFASSFTDAYIGFSVQRTTGGAVAYEGQIISYNPATSPPTVTLTPALPGAATWGASDTFKVLRAAPAKLAAIFHGGASIAGVGNTGITTFNGLLNANGLVNCAVVQFGATFPLVPGGIGGQKYGA